MFWKFYQNKYRVQECLVTSVKDDDANHDGTWRQLVSDAERIVLVKKIKVHGNG